MLHYSPTNLSSPSREKTKLRRNAIQKRLYLDKCLKTFLESRQEAGPKAQKGLDRRSQQD